MRWSRPAVCFVAVLACACGSRSNDRTDAGADANSLCLQDPTLGGRSRECGMVGGEVECGSCNEDLWCDNPQGYCRELAGDCARCSGSCALNGNCVGSPCEGRCDETILVPEGEVMVATGFPDETVVELVPAFRIGKYETTISRYRECVQAGACQEPYFDSVDLGVVGAFWDPANDVFPIDGARKVDAVAFCEWDGGRLPTRAEWTKAARGGCDLRGSPATCDDPEDFVRYPWGDDEPTCDRANFSPDFNSGDYCAGRIERVGSFPNGQSIYGAHDMIGNVAEFMAAPCFLAEPMEFCLHESSWPRSARVTINSALGGDGGSGGFRCAYAP